MRRLPSVLLVLALAPVLVVAGPTLTKPTPEPHAVKPSVHSIPLRGVEQSELAGFRAATRNAEPAHPPAEHAPGAGRTAVLTAPMSTRAFEALGVTWRPAPAGTEVAVDVRTRDDGAADGGWTDWKALNVDPGEGAPDADTAEVEDNPEYREGTAPYLLRASDGVQVRVGLLSGRLPHGLRVDLVNPGESSADSHLSPSPPAGSAAAAAPKPTIISRKQWGADESLRSGSPNYTSTIKAGFVHHTVSSNSYTQAGAASLVRSVYAYHTQSRGYSDIGYNFIVDKHGQIFEGRAGGIERAVLGAHTGGFNTNTFAASALGNFDTATPPKAMLTAYEKLLAWKLSLHGRNATGSTTLTSSGGGTSRYPAGQAVSFRVISGHRDAGFTACPGKNLYAKLPGLRTGVKERMDSGGGTPTPPPTTPPPTPPPSTSPDSSFVPVSQTTVASTRSGLRVPQGAGAMRGDYDRFSFSPLGKAGVPTSGVAAVSLQLRGTTTGVGKIAAFPTGKPSAVRSLSLVPHRWRTGHVPVGIGGEGRVTVSADASGATQADVAVTGYYLRGRDGLQFHPTSPTRILRTAATPRPGALHANEARFVDVDGISAVPSGARALAVNVIARDATQDTSVSVYPAEGQRPNVPTLDVQRGENARRMVMVGLSEWSNLTAYNRSGRVQLALDVAGYYRSPQAGDGYDFVPVNPRRVASTASGLGVRKGRVGDDRSVDFTVAGRAGVPDSGVKRVLLSLSSHTRTQSGFVYAYAAGTPRPGVANLSGRGGRTETNLVVVPVSSNGRVRVLNSAGSTHVTADVVGYHRD